MALLTETLESTNSKDRTAPAWQALDTWAVLLMGTGTILSRIPFRAELLNSFDAVNYTLALTHFDMRLAQPQAPGYPLYILLGRLFSAAHRLVTGTIDNPAALVWLSMVFSGLAVAAIYLAAREMYDRQVGLLAALLVSVSTVFWYMGEIAAPYTIDLFASAIVGWLCYRNIASSREGSVWICALAVGLAGALRLQTLVFLLPLFLYSLLNAGSLYSPRKRSWRVTLAASGLALLVFAAFFLPAVMLSGGPAAFMQEMRGILPIFRDTDTLIRSTRLARFAYNLGTISRYTLRILGELSLPFLLLGFFSAAGELLHSTPVTGGLVSPGHSNRFLSRLSTGRSHRLLFLMLWLLPSWIFYFLIWPGNLGTMLVSTPPLFVLTALGLARLINPSRRTGYLFGGLLLAVLISWSILVFSLLPRAPFGKAYRTFDNYDSLVDTTRSYQARLDLVRGVPAEGTIVYANDFRHLQYYLPQYHTFSYPRFNRHDPEVVELIISIEGGKMQARKNIAASSLVPDGTRRIVIFDSANKLQIDDRLEMERESLAGHSIQVISIPAGQQVYWNEKGLTARYEPQD